MTAAKFAQTNFNTQDPTTYRGNIDANFAVGALMIGNFAPHAKSTPDMTVQLDAGAIPSAGALPTSQAQQTSATLTAPSANPRNDIVYIDAITGAIGVATGAEAAIPSDPAIPAGKIPVARLAMTVGMTTITNNIITDLRAPALAASSGTSYTLISSNTTLTVGQSGGRFGLSGASTTATLPTPVGNPNVGYILWGTDSNTQTISTPAATFNLPDGTTPTSLTVTNNQGVEVVSDGSVYRVIRMWGKQVSQTPATADSSTKVATTAMVQAAILANIVPTFTTGDVKLTLKAAADAGWVMMNDGTIGNASSGGTTRANADTQALFELLWNNISNAWAPVSSGRGASAAADFAANKTITLPRSLGRALAIAGAGSGLTSRALGEYLGAETHTLVVGEMPSHTHDATPVVGTGPLTGINTTADANNYTTPIAPTSSTGGGGAHNNMQPSTFLNVMVKL